MGEQPGEQRPGRVARRMRDAEHGRSDGQFTAVRAIVPPGDGGRQGDQVDRERGQPHQQRHAQRAPVTRRGRRRQDEIGRG